MNDLRNCVLFKSIPVISEWWVGDNERLCSMEPRLLLKRALSQARLEPGTARSAGQRLSHLAIGALIHMSTAILYSLSQCAFGGSKTNHSSKFD